MTYQHNNWHPKGAGRNLRKRTPIRLENGQPHLMDDGKLVRLACLFLTAGTIIILLHLAQRMNL